MRPQATGRRAGRELVGHPGADAVRGLARCRVLARCPTPHAPDTGGDRCSRSGRAGRPAAGRRRGGARRDVRQRRRRGQRLGAGGRWRATSSASTPARRPRRRSACTCAGSSTCRRRSPCSRRASTATDLSVKEIDQTLARLTDEVAEPAAVGDLDGLRVRLEALRTTAAERRAVAEAERAAAREAAVVARTEIVEQAEKIAATDPSRIQWRPAGEQLRLLLDQWKEAQRSGPRLDRPTEESLWKRFSHARTTFDRERRHYFAELETRNASAKSVKEELVAEAEALQSSTDWGATAGVFRDLMAQWKAAGRASRADDDALWARFRAAQDAFFAARDGQRPRPTRSPREPGGQGGAPGRGRGAAPGHRPRRRQDGAAPIQERWEAAGRVPRGDVQRVEARLRAVETAVRDTDQAQWTRTNPETRARAEGAAAQLEQAIAGLEADLDRAKAAGDKRKIADAQAAIDARRAWLEQVQRAAQDARG